MTAVHVTIDQLVVHGLSAEMGREVGALVRQRLAALAAGHDESRRTPRSEPQRIADVVARDVWARVVAEREAAR